MTPQCYFNRIHFPKKAFSNLHLNLEQKDIIYWQVLLASNRDDYLIIAVHCFQYQIKKWVTFQNNAFWWIKAAHNMNLKNTSTVFSSYLFKNTTIWHHCSSCLFISTVFFLVIKILFTVFFLQLPPVFTDHWSLFRSLNRAFVTMFQR